MSEIDQALTRLFDRQRIIFWYDDKRELREDFEALALSGVEKIVLENNQFGVKHRILHRESEQKFLLYHEGPPPIDLDNWLLDVELAYGLFRSDQASLWLSELGLGVVEFGDLAQEHAEFFNAAKRRESLKALIQADDTKGLVRLKMLAVCATAEPRLDDIMENLLAELSQERDKKFHLIQRCSLDTVLWEQLERVYGYTSETPSPQDFAIELFSSCYLSGLGEPSTLQNDAIVFLNRWKDSVRHHESFERLSAECADILGIEQDLQGRSYKALVDLDTFELIDRKILSELVRDVSNRTISTKESEQLIRQRRHSHWYRLHENSYQAINYAAQIFQAMENVDLTIYSLTHGIQQYSQVWYQIDQLYRKVIYHARQSGQTTLLAELLDQVENRYTNSYLLKINTEWQPFVDSCTKWAARPILNQEEFFEERVAPFLRKDKKIFVVISDALRYEIGEELLRVIRQEDRYEATLDPALSVLPSYTQLGMAALLPHENLSFAVHAKTVLVDGESSQGTENRKNILERALPKRATAIKAKDFLSMNREISRTLIRDHDVVYLYHNRIDATGDKRDSEERVFDAAEETLNDLMNLIKKLANANANNMIVTADHGFIYQHRAIDESDFSAGEASGDEIFAINRRFVLGKGLTTTSSFKHFTAEEVGLDGDMEILLPKTINRLRVKGAGSRYVHGGASLQEVVVPIIQINKKRQSDITQVQVDIFRSATSIITTGQLTAAFYQTEAVTEKVQPRILRAGIYSQDGELISDQHELVFDFSSDNERDRELQVRFVLTHKADEANEQEVILRLDERVPDTAHYREYKTARYLLRRSFTSDFDL